MRTFFTFKKIAASQSVNDGMGSLANVSSKSHALRGSGRATHIELGPDRVQVNDHVRDRGSTNAH